MVWGGGWNIDYEITIINTVILLNDIPVKKDNEAEKNDMIYFDIIA